MENCVYFSALAIAFGLGFAVCAAVFADRIGGRTPPASNNSARVEICCMCKQPLPKVFSRSSAGRFFCMECVNKLSPVA